MRFFYQEDLNDCGLACLAMVISHHHNHYISPYQLKKMLSSDARGGISFYDLITLGSNFYLKGIAYACEIEFLKHQTKFPILLNIKDKNSLNHFVILTGVNDKKVSILDPSFKAGSRELDWCELAECYLGQIVIFEKLKQWKPRLNWGLVFNYVKKFWFLILVITLMTTLSNYFWFLTNFFIRVLEVWFQTGEISQFVIIKFGLYFLGGATCYLLQIWSTNYLRQLLWKHLIANELRHLDAKINNQTMQSGFWDVLNGHYQVLNLLLILIAKFFSHSLLLPLIIWIILKTNFWILLIYGLFILINAVATNFYLKFFFQMQEEIDTKKAKYHFKLVFYLTNFTNLKNKQYDRLNLELLNDEQNKYFKAERKQNFWFSLTDLNQQITQKVFNLVFWVLIFWLVLKTSKPIDDLLILSLVVQLSIALSIDLVHHWFSFWHQKNNLHSLKSLNIRTQSKLPFQANKEIPIIQFQNFSFETPGHLYLVKNSTFKLPLQILGPPEILDSFYQACLLSKSDLFINSHSINDYQEQLFAIDYQALPIASSVIQNLFLGKTTNKEIIEKINLPYWFSKYNLDWNSDINSSTITKSQLQVLNFLSLLLSDYQLYFLNRALSDISDQDQFLLWELLFKFKANKALIIIGEIKLPTAVFIERMQLEDMI